MNTRVLIAVTFGVLVSGLAGCDPAPGRAPSAAAPTAASPPPSSAAPSSTAVAVHAIPDRAFLQQPDTNRADAPYEVPSAGMLPPLCGARYGSDALVAARRTLHVIFSAQPPKQDFVPVPDGTFDETITTYQRDGAEQFMRQLRSAVSACPAETREGVRYRIRLLTATERGDDAILFELRSPARDSEGNPTGGDDVSLVAAVRVGTAVLVLLANGWERGSADPAVVDRFTQTAFDRLRAWFLGGR
ncbi:hypothetical protein ABZS66_26160 [Dactylosporangium sp. NPDC005572]|uniref:hypothetical protein n=1 Tax=Dactylosporangium sp. NPDC005572 TaxID=3156889 RepID=UPI0033AAFCCF